MKNIQITTLDNGLRVATDRIESVETASLGMWIAAGARHEAHEINGIAHLLEHMLFKGTTRRDAFAISHEIEAVGGHMNAYTARENTAFHAKVLKEHVPLAVDVLADILQHSVFDQTELERERDVVVQEIAQSRDTPDDIIFDWFQAKAYPDQPLGRPVLGEEDIVNSIGRDRLMSHKDRQYRTSDMVFSAAGKVDHDTFVDLVRSQFETLQPGSADDIAPANYDGGDRRETRDLEQLHMVVGFPGVSVRAPDFYAAALLSNLLGGGMSSRLFQEIREKRGLAYSIYSFTSSFRDSGLFGIYTGTSPGTAADLLPAMADQLLAVTENITEEELESSRAQLKASLLMGLESTGARCEQLAQHLMIFGRPLTIEEIVGQIDRVDRRHVMGLAKQIFAGTPTITVLGPQSALETYDSFNARFAA